MICGIGVDIVHISRMKKWIKNKGLLERYFNEEELLIVQKKPGGLEASLAARFAAKEAFGKALGTGFEGIILKDITVINMHNGQPDIKIKGTALKAMKRKGASIIHLSLSHERDNAIAMVVLEYERS